MKSMKRLSILMMLMLSLSLTLGACGGGDYGQEGDEETGAAATYGNDEDNAAMNEDDEAYGENGEDMEESAEQAEEARSLVSEAAGVAEQMKDDPELSKLMQQAKGVFIVPDYGQGAIGVGGRGGEGVLLAKNGGQWSDPAFYDIGAVSIGAQIGGTAGQIAMLLMTDDAVESFKQENNFSLNTDADLTIVDYSAHAQGSVGKGEDVIFWSDTEGAFAGVSLSATDIHWDDEENNAYYGQSATAQDVLTGKLSSPDSDRLQNALPA